jgi:hypothetical protein
MAQSSKVSGFLRKKQQYKFIILVYNIPLSGTQDSNINLN